MRYIAPIIPLLLCCFCHAQDLNGIWQGTLEQAAGGCYTQYNIELQVHFNAANNSLKGMAYDYYDITKYVKLDFSGRYNNSTMRMVLVENDLEEAHIPELCVPCIKTYDLTWSRQGGEEVLSGECRGRAYGENMACPPYKVLLKRAARSHFAPDIDQQPDLKELQKKLQLQPRAKDLVKTIIVPSREIKLDFYDNAEIDNDTITVLLNGKLLLYRQMLKATPLTIHINAFPNTDYEVVMYADNLGSIPPNTALLVITAGAKKYEVRLASSEEKSAAVRFRYEAP